jgi:hypothetical protein
VFDSSDRARSFPPAYFFSLSQHVDVGLSVHCVAGARSFRLEVVHVCSQRFATHQAR